MGKSDKNNPSSPTDTSQLLFLSLFLLLIAFFILLNSLSTIDETRSRKVVSSVAAAFRIVPAPDANSPVVIADLGPLAEPEQLLDAMRQLWVASVQLRNIRTPTPGRLSLIRAGAVANELKRIGIQRNITILGLGQSRYKHLDSGFTAERRSRLAHRVDIVIHPTKEEP